MSTIDVETLRSWLEAGKPVTILDVRSTHDRLEWAIPGSLHVDAYADLNAHNVHALDNVSLPADVPVVTICNAGRVSQVASELLAARGLEAHSLEGGMRAWSVAWNTAEVTVPNSNARVIQVRRVGKGCLSYLIGSGKEAAVIDASLAPEVYLDLAQGFGWQIVAVLDTHIHADHLSRSRLLAERCGATLYLPHQDRVTYSFTPNEDGTTIKIGSASLTALRSPGHTLESTCYLFDQQVLFSGDTLFLQGVGRSDLHASAEETRARARLLYQSLQRLLRLPPHTLLLPGHASIPTPFDKKPLVAPLSDVRAQVGLLQLPESEFVEALLARIPPTPPNHLRIIELNEAGQLIENPIEVEAGANHCAIA